MTTSSTAVSTDFQRHGKEESLFNFRFCMALENEILCLPWHLVLVYFWNTYLNFPLRFLFSYGTDRGIIIFRYPIIHIEKRICILFFVYVWHSLQNGCNFALLFFVKTYLRGKQTITKTLFTSCNTKTQQIDLIHGTRHHLVLIAELLARAKRARGRSPIAKENYPSQKNLVIT